ncbi:hypothetical protein NWP17_12685 [Chrysosporum bergii ANA360D]|uniref:Uncharacterized protein n=1 Tax=Chrysosporum bergii ANA360D TaxID=617107 RepID=A0AA43GTG9_9CYAN|nr:hypothetical protein [Chrysosporum bergii]MDH6061281.1 hypothetical protein [Chrysosporum bergii ANA360D]
MLQLSLAYGVSQGNIKRSRCVLPYTWLRYHFLAMPPAIAQYEE